MRIFVAGATGAIGRQLIPLLVEAGHHVTGMTRSEDKTDALRAAGATPVVCDLFDSALAAAVTDARPDLVMHQVTDLPQHAALLPLKLPGLNRVRRAGTDRLISAAHVAGADRFLAQSVAFSLPGIAQKAVDYLEAATLAYPGVVLRYGRFYGPGTWSADAPSEGGVEVRHAAARTVEMLDAEPGVYEVLDPATGVAARK